MLEIYNRLFTSADMIKSFPDDNTRREYILNNQLFGVATSNMAATVARKSLYNDAKKTGNIIYTADKATK